jgi:hypothetical protein
VNDLTWLADFAWGCKVWIFWSLATLIVVLSHLLDRLGRKRGLSDEAVALIWLLCIQATLVPFFGFLSYQCFEHPERLDAYPDPINRWADDMRNFWPLAAALEVVLIAWALRLARSLYWKRRAGRLMNRVKRLRDEGRLKEAEVAYLQWRRIYETRCGGRPGPMPPHLRHRS